MDLPANLIPNDSSVEMKYCCHCKTLKPITEFHKSNSAKDGHQPVCKECRRVLDKKRREDKLFNTSVQETIESADNRAVIKTIDGKTLIKRDTTNFKSLEEYAPRELLAELKRRGYIWSDMYVKQAVDWNKI